MKAAAEGLKTTKVGKGAVNVVQDALSRVTAALLALKTQAAAYDEKHQVSAKVSATKTNLTESVEGYVSSAREKTATSIAYAQERASEYQTSAAAAGTSAGQSAVKMVDNVTKKVGEYDEYYQVSNKVTIAAQEATTKAKEWDAYYGVSEKAKALDTQAGGYGAMAVTKGNELAQNGTKLVNEKLAATRASLTDVEVGGTEEVGANMEDVPDKLNH